MNRAYNNCTLIALTAFALSAAAHAHFQTLIPSQDHVSDPNSATITFDIRFTHPMAGGPLMSMRMPAMELYIRGQRSSFPTERLRHVDESGKVTYRTSYTLDRPGDHVFVLHPAKYWEEAEQTYIVHFTKVIVDGFGGGGGWSRPVGVPVEIVPRVKPYALWTGNTFQGVVLHNGELVPSARVEVEYLNDTEPKVTIPTSAYETQVVYANGEGEFVYTIPRAGWWGFAALVDGPKEDLKSPDGEPADMEWGGLIWVHAVDME